MSPLAWAAGIAILAAIVVGLQTRAAARLLACVGLVAVMAPLAATPLPPAVAVAFRALAAFLAAYVAVLLARRGARQLPALPLGGRPEAAFAVVAFAVGIGATGAALPGATPSVGGSPAALLADPLALALALALGVAALDLIGFGRDPLHVASGSALGVIAGDLALRGVLGPASALTDVAAGVAVLVALVVGVIQGTAGTAPRGATEGA